MHAWATTVQVAPQQCGSGKRLVFGPLHKAVNVSGVEFLGAPLRGLSGSEAKAFFRQRMWVVRTVRTFKPSWSATTWANGPNRAATGSTPARDSY